MVGERDGEGQRGEDEAGVDLGSRQDSTPWSTWLSSPVFGPDDASTNFACLIPQRNTICGCQSIGSLAVTVRRRWARCCHSRAADYSIVGKPGIYDMTLLVDGRPDAREY